MGWIKERIEAEKRKHGSMPMGQERFNLDWARLAEAKIIKELSFRISNSPYISTSMVERHISSLNLNKESQE